MLDLDDRAQGVGAILGWLQRKWLERLLIALARKAQQLCGDLSQLSCGDQGPASTGIGLCTMAAKPVANPPACATKIVNAGVVIGTAANGACLRICHHNIPDPTPPSVPSGSARVGLNTGTARALPAAIAAIRSSKLGGSISLPIGLGVGEVSGGAEDGLP